MKKIIVFILSIVLIWSCSKKTIPSKSIETAAPPKTDSIVVNVVAGMALFETKCNRCHDLPKPEAYTSERWPGIIHWMAPKARLTDEEKSNVMAYVLANAKK